MSYFYLLWILNKENKSINESHNLCGGLSEKNEEEIKGNSKQNFFPEKYLNQTVLTTPANINKPTVLGKQGNN